jgi:hypothetical protein
MSLQASLFTTCRADVERVAEDQNKLEAVAC